MVIVNTLELVARLTPSIARQVDAAVAKHGPFTSDPLRGVAILTEEVGEVAEAMLGVTKTPDPYHTEEELFMEIMHTMAVCVLLILAFTGRPVPETDDTNATLN